MRLTFRRQVSELFKNQFEPRVRVVSNSGSRIKPVYEAKVDSSGVIDLVQTGTENLYDYIQSHKDSCDINLIVKKFAAGDIDVLSKRQGTYGDFTELPETYAEMLNIVISGENMFNELPVELRAKFHYSFREWMSSMDNWSEFAEKMGLTEGKQPVVEPAAGDVAGAEDPSSEGGDA